MKLGGDKKINFILLILWGIFLPLFLVLPIKFIGYSEIIEEIAKAIIIFWLVMPVFRFVHGVLLSGLFGLLFAFSETGLYLNNILNSGRLENLWQRLIWTSLLHILTVIIIFIFGKLNRWLIIVGVILAIILHYFGNFVLADFLL